MAKRFTDTTKWTNPWYRKMPYQYRDLWDYICDMCDHAGIWRADLEMASMIIGDSLTKEKALFFFGDRIVVLSEDKWFLPSFIRFQYGNINSQKAVCVSVRNILISNGIDIDTLMIKQSLHNHSSMIKDKDKDKDKVKDKDTVKEKEKENTSDLICQAWDVWQETMIFFKLPKQNISPHQESSLARAIASLGIETVLLALEGQRYESGSDKFNPRDHLSIDRVLHKDSKGQQRWEKFANMARAKKQEQENKPTDDDLQKLGRGY
jgi:hypothetical protein